MEETKKQFTSPYSFQRTMGKDELTYQAQPNVVTMVARQLDDFGIVYSRQGAAIYIEGRENLEKVVDAGGRFTGSAEFLSGLSAA